MSEKGINACVWHFCFSNMSISIFPLSHSCISMNIKTSKNKTNPTQLNCSPHPKTNFILFVFESLKFHHRKLNWNFFYSNRGYHFLLVNHFPCELVYMSEPKRFALIIQHLTSCVIYLYMHFISICRFSFNFSSRSLRSPSLSLSLD